MKLMALPASSMKAFLLCQITRLVQENYLSVGTESLAVSVDSRIAISINV